MQQISLDTLRSLVTIIEVGSFQKAGELLGRTQPAISLQIKKLEQQLAQKLFEKNGQSYRPNQEGKWLYQQARRMLAINDEIFREIGQQRLRGRLRLGIPSEFANALLPSIIGEFSQRYPDITLEVTSALSKQLLTQFASDQFDLILALIPSNQKTLGDTVIQDQLVWVGNKGSPLPKDNIRLVVAPEGCVYRSRIIERLKQQTYAWKITFTNADLYGLSEAIRQGLGITALAKSSIPNNLTIIKDKRLPPLGKVNICLISQDDQGSQIIQTLQDFIKARLRHN